jgi:hypothetical protein
MELFGGRVGEGVAEGGSGGDAEFGEDLVEMGPSRPGDCSEPVKGLRGVRELAAGVGRSFSSAQVGAVGELDSAQVERPAGVARFGDCLFERAGVYFGVSDDAGG